MHRVTRALSCCALPFLSACGAPPVTVADLDPSQWALRFATSELPGQVAVTLTMAEVCGPLSALFRVRLGGTPLDLTREGRTFVGSSSGPPFAGAPVVSCESAEFMGVVDAALLIEGVELLATDGLEERVLRGGPLVSEANVRAGPAIHPFLLPPSSLALPVALERGGPLFVFFEGEGGEAIGPFIDDATTAVWLQPDGDVAPIAVTWAEEGPGRSVPSSTPLGAARIEVLAITGIPTDASADSFALCEGDVCVRAPIVVRASRSAEVVECPRDDCALLLDETPPCVLYGSSWEQETDGCTVAFAVADDCAWSSPALRCATVAAGSSAACTCVVDGEDGLAFTIWEDLCAFDFAISGIASAMCPYAFGGDIPIVR